jgi:hypothetical protein
MKCSTCVGEGLQSTVTEMVLASQCVHWFPYYDQDGKQHSHDPNLHTTAYECSNGHTWVENKRRECWCGWPHGVVDGI